MKSTAGSDAAKQRAGEAAAEEVTDGMVVGLGTGSTTAYAIKALGERVDSGLDVAGVPTSFGARQLAIDQGIDLVGLDEVDRIDLAIDGADQFVVETGDCIKGGGAAHTREKIVAAAADDFAVVVDETKLADELEYPVALEVIPAAQPGVETAVETAGGTPRLRQAANKDGPVVTDNGNLVIDCAFGPITDPKTVALELVEIPGVVEHGLFVGRTTTAYVGTEDGLNVHRY